MFAVIYLFKVKKGSEKVFESSWDELTKLIYQHNGSLGSRLHLNQNGDYIAYAQWPDELLWENSASMTIAGSEKAILEMKNACDEIKVLHKLKMVTDLLKNETFNG